MSAQRGEGEATGLRRYISFETGGKERCQWLHRQAEPRVGGDRRLRGVGWQAPGKEEHLSDFPQSLRTGRQRDRITPHRATV